MVTGQSPPLPPEDTSPPQLVTAQAGTTPTKMRSEDDASDDGAAALGHGDFTAKQIRSHNSNVRAIRKRALDRLKDTDVCHASVPPATNASEGCTLSRDRPPRHTSCAGRAPVVHSRREIRNVAHPTCAMVDAGSIRDPMSLSCGSESGAESSTTGANPGGGAGAGGMADASGMAGNEVGRDAASVDGDVSVPSSDAAGDGTACFALFHACSIRR